MRVSGVARADVHATGRACRRTPSTTLRVVPLPLRGRTLETAGRASRNPPPQGEGTAGTAVGERGIARDEVHRTGRAGCEPLQHALRSSPSPFGSGVR